MCTSPHMVTSLMNHDIYPIKGNMVAPTLPWAPLDPPLPHYEYHTINYANMPPARAPIPRSR